MAGQYIFHSPLYHLSAQSSFWSHIIINNLDIGVVALRGNLGSEIFVVGLIQFWHYTDEKRWDLMGVIVAGNNRLCPATFKP